MCRTSRNRLIYCGSAILIALLITMPAAARAQRGGGHGGNFGSHYGFAFHNHGPGIRNLALGNPPFRSTVVPPVSGTIVPPFSGAAVAPPFGATILNSAPVGGGIWRWHPGAWHHDGFHGNVGNLSVFDQGRPFGGSPSFSKSPLALPVDIAPAVAAVDVWHLDGGVWHRNPGQSPPQVWTRDNDGTWHESAGRSN